MNARIARCLSAALILFLICIQATLSHAASAGQSAYKQGQADYHAAKYQQAVSDFVTAINDGYRTAGAYYELGLSYSRLKQWDNAVWAYQSAVQVDSSFAAAHPTLTSKLKQAQSKGGANHGAPAAITATPAGGTTPASGNTTSPAGPGSVQAAQIATTLQNSPVYIAPALSKTIGSGSETLSATAVALKDQSTTVVRFAFISGIPSGYGTLGSYTYDLFNRLGIKRSVVIVVSPRGVSARTDRLSAADTQTLTDQSRAQFLQGSYVQGADSLARAIVSRADSKDQTSKRNTTVIIAIVIVIVVVVLLLFFGSRIRRWRRAYRSAAEWRDRLTPLLTDTSEQVDTLLPDHPARRIFLDASAYYSTASKILDNVQNTSATAAALSTGRLMNALGQARSALQAAEKALRQAGILISGGTLPADEAPVAGGEITPPAEFRDRASDGAAQAACFFCARPLNAATAETVTVPVGGATRQVMVCDEHAADIRAGRQPAVRTVPDPANSGRPAPWWNVPTYTPARDYVYDPYYYRGGGLSWGDLLLYDALFDQPRNEYVYINDDNRNYDQAGFLGYSSDRPDSTSFDTGGRDQPSAAETDFFTGGDSGGDRS